MLFARAITAFLLLSALALGARAEDYPTRPITLILPLGAGGAMDILARGQLGPKLAERLGKPVDHREPHRRRHGDRGDRGREKPARRLHAVLHARRHAHHQCRRSTSKLPYDPAKDFVPIALTSKVGFMLVVNPSLPVNSVAELVKYAKERPGQLSYGSTGIGATPHLAFEMFQRAAGIKMTHVPYRGMPPATNDVVAGHIQMVVHRSGLRAAADRRRQAQGACGVLAHPHRVRARRADARRAWLQGFRGGVLAHGRRRRPARRRRS